MAKGDTQSTAIGPSRKRSQNGTTIIQDFQQ
jgi:hypothetical protein